MTVPQLVIDHCYAIVREHDKDRYLATLFAPQERRPHLWALLAFNYEIARLRELVSGPAPGEVRLHWWTEVIDAIYTGITVDHPVAVGLTAAIKQGDLPKSAFVNLIEARRFDLYDDAMPSLTDLEGYLGETSSVLIQLGSLVLAGAAAAGTATASGYAGVAFGMTGLLRALPIHRSRGQCYVPKDLLERTGLAPSDLLAPRPPANILKVIEELITVARDRLAAARKLRNDVPAAAMPAFLPVTLVDDYLAMLTRMGVEVLSQVAEIPQWRRQLRLWRKARKGEF